MLSLMTIVIDEITYHDVCQILVNLCSPSDALDESIIWVRWWKWCYRWMKNQKIEAKKIEIIEWLHNVCNLKYVEE